MYACIDAGHGDRDHRAERERREARERRKQQPAALSDRRSCARRAGQREQQAGDPADPHARRDSTCSTSEGKNTPRGLSMLACPASAGVIAR